MVSTEWRHRPGYGVAYLVPRVDPRLSPRDKEVRLLGVAASEEEAVAMIIMAMKESKDW